MNTIECDINSEFIVERFPVKSEDIDSIITWADLIKVDAESNAATIFDHLTRVNVQLFSQKRNWQLVNDVDYMPTSYTVKVHFLSLVKMLCSGNRKYETL